MIKVTKLEIEIGLYLKEMGGSDYSELCEEFKNEDSDDIYDAIKSLKEKGYIYSYNDDDVTCYDLQFSDFLEDKTAIKHPFIEVLENIENIDKNNEVVKKEDELSETQLRIGKFLYQESLSTPTDIYMELDDVVIDEVNIALDDLVKKEFIYVLDSREVMYDLTSKFIGIIEEGQKEEPQFHKTVGIECHKCGHKGDIDLMRKAGGLFGTPNRTHIFGVCPKCDTTVISYFI